MTRPIATIAIVTTTPRTLNEKAHGPTSRGFSAADEALLNEMARTLNLTPGAVVEELVTCALADYRRMHVIQRVPPAPRTWRYGAPHEEEAL
jgi:hypothetical protein